jgi:hypothetical protein
MTRRPLPRDSGAYGGRRGSAGIATCGEVAGHRTMIFQCAIYLESPGVLSGGRGRPEILRPQFFNNICEGIPQGYTGLKLTDLTVEI